MIFLLLLLGAVLVRMLAEKYYEKNWQKHLQVSVKFQEDPITQGEEGMLTEIIENRKRLFLPMLQAGFAVSRNLNFSVEENTSVSDKSYKRDIFSVMGYQRITRQVPFAGEKRGYYEIQKIELLSKGILMTHNLYGTLPCSTYLYVYPKLMEGLEWKVLFQKITGTIAARKRLMEDPFFFRGIREYTVHDPMNKINWKASAKTGEWMVNMQDSATGGNVYLLLDTEDETIWKYEEIHEEGIRLAAAGARILLNQGIETGLITNGRDCITGEEIQVSARGGRGQMAKILQSLSRIDLSRQPGKFSDTLEKKLEGLYEQESYCILITKNQYSLLAEQMELLAKKNQGCFCLLTLYPEMEWNMRGKGSMQAARWEVKR